MSTETLLRVRSAPHPDDTFVPQRGATSLSLERQRRGRLRRRTRQSGTVRFLHWQGPARPRRSRTVPVVLVHGLVVASSMCVPLAERLAEDGPVYCPDLPGFGRSSKPRPPLSVPELGDALSAWVDAEVGEPVVLVGTSLGAQVALSAAVRAPQSVTGVVLVSPTVDGERRRWRRQLWRWQIEQTTQSAGLKMVQARDYLRAGVPRAVRTFSKALDHRPEEDVRSLQMPSLMVWGGRDPLLRREWVRTLAHRAPGGRYASIPSAVHAMSYENPLELSRVVNGFIDGLSSPAAGVDH